MDKYKALMDAQVLIKNARQAQPVVFNNPAYDKLMRIGRLIEAQAAEVLREVTCE